MIRSMECRVRGGEFLDEPLRRIESTSAHFVDSRDPHKKGIGYEIQTYHVTAGSCLPTNLVATHLNTFITPYFRISYEFFC